MIVVYVISAYEKRISKNRNLIKKLLSSAWVKVSVKRDAV